MCLFMVGLACRGDPRVADVRSIGDGLETVADASRGEVTVLVA
jgi:hypothetical protein